MNDILLETRLQDRTMLRKDMRDVVNESSELKLLLTKGNALERDRILRALGKFVADAKKQDASIGLIQHDASDLNGVLKASAPTTITPTLTPVVASGDGYVDMANKELSKGVDWLKEGLPKRLFEESAHDTYVTLGPSEHNFSKALILPVSSAAEQPASRFAATPVNSAAVVIQSPSPTTGAAVNTVHDRDQDAPAPILTPADAHRYVLENRRPTKHIETPKDVPSHLLLSKKSTRSEKAAKHSVETVLAAQKARVSRVTPPQGKASDKAVRNLWQTALAPEVQSVNAAVAPQLRHIKEHRETMHQAIQRNLNAVTAAITSWK
jgi:hypothetical protein